MKPNNLNLFNIDSLFQKQFRLKPMANWDFRTFQEQLGCKVNWGFVTGRSLTGKSTVAQNLCNL